MRKVPDPVIMAVAFIIAACSGCLGYWGIYSGLFESVWLQIGVGILVGSTLGLTLWLYTLILRDRMIPKTYPIAIVGFPQSGKTTLIVSLFGEVFAGKIEQYKLNPKGTQTIERVNECIAMLDKGNALAPTKDQDRFAFRADTEVKGFPFSRVYKVEFGDFPGDNSQLYAFQYGRWLHNTEFFKWVADCEAMVFVVDVGRYLARKAGKEKYIADMSSAIRAAWQHFVNVNEHRIKKVRRHPVVLAFTKADLFGVKRGSKNWDQFEQEIARLGFSGKTPRIAEIDPKALERGKQQVMTDFSELIRYLQTDAPSFDIVFCSCFGMENEKRLGLDTLLKTVFPS